MSSVDQIVPQTSTLPNLPSAARWVLAAVLITNIGNGIHTIAVGKLLYDKTGTVAAFGGVLMAEYVINFLLQALAGSIVDRGNPKFVWIWGDILRGLFICTASLMLVTPQMYWWVFASIVVINLAKPFYRSATFALGPAIVPGEGLIKYNALSASFLQIGQLLGVALVGPVIQYFGAGVAFAINGVSFLLSGLVIALANVPSIDTNVKNIADPWLKRFADDWKEIVYLLRSDTPFLWHIVLCAGDFLAVSFVNLTLVPMVHQRFGDNSYWLSAFDGAFAIGAIMSVGLGEPLIKTLSLRNAAAVGLGVQAALFGLLAVMRNPYLVVPVMLMLGTMNAFSLTVFLSNLQRRSHGPIKGRIAGVRYLVLSILAGLFLPLVTTAQTVSLEWGLLASALVCIAFSMTTFILTRQQVFGMSLIRQEN